jgi:hypothetical protein
MNLKEELEERIFDMEKVAQVFNIEEVVTHSCDLSRELVTTYVD